MTLPPHPYWLSVSTMLMGYITGSNKYTLNPVEKSITYSFLGTSTFLMFWRNSGLVEPKLKQLYKPSVLFTGNVIGSILSMGSIYCMGHLLGIANNNKKFQNNPQIKNLIDGTPLK